jgi:hypothetical protein
MLPSKLRSNDQSEPSQVGLRPAGLCFDNAPECSQGEGILGVME